MIDQKETIDSLGFSEYNQAKSKRPQTKTPYTPQGRDGFQTPNYGTELLIPFIPKGIKWIWEPAVGQGKIRRVLEKHGYSVLGSDLVYNDSVDLVFNFVEDEQNFDFPPVECIITNPPFSLKIDFWEKCLEYDKPFALLIPADYAGWNIAACWRLGCEKIIPSRRIDYITPSGLSGVSGHTADFHSMWLTWGFGLGRTETFVELSLEDKRLNI